MRRAGKSITPIFRGFVESGKLKLVRPELFASFLLGIQGDVEMVVKKPRKERSLNQQGYYFGVVVKMIADELGYLKPEDAHNELRAMFLLIEEKPMRRYRSTTDLSTVEMEEYMSKIRAWAAIEIPLFIPLPNEIEETRYVG